LKTKIILLAFMSVSLVGAAYSQVKVAFVDSDVILKQLPEAQAVQKQLEDLQKLYVDTLTAKETEYKTKAEALKIKYDAAQQQVQAGKLTPDQVKALDAEISEMQTELQRLEQDYGEYKQNVQQALLAKQAELFKPVKEKITRTIEQVAKELKYNFVLDKAGETLIYGDKELDITFKILDKLK
jgi:outer membrane protein